MKKRWLAMLVVGCMLIGSMGMTAMAENETTDGGNGGAAGEENGALTGQGNEAEPADSSKSTASELVEVDGNTLVENPFTVSGNTLIKYNYAGEYKGDHSKAVLNIKVPDGVTCIGNGKDSLSCPHFAFVNITLPEGLVRIENMALMGIRMTKTLTLPDSVTYIGADAFMSAYIDEVIIPGKVKMADYAFETSHVRKVTFQEGVKDISAYAFFCSHDLTSVSIPSSVINIKKGALHDCPNLKDIYYAGTKQQWEQISMGEAVFAYIENLTVHCTDGDIVIASSQTTPETPPETSQPEENKPAAPGESNPAPSESKNNSGGSSSHSSGSSSQNNKPASAPAPSEPKTEQEAVRETIENLPQGGRAMLETSSVIGSGELRKIMEKGGSMVVFSPQVSWHFDVLTNGDMDFNPGIEVGADIPDLVQKLNGQSATPIRFAHNGVLSGAAHVGIAVSYAPGTRLYFYYYNRSTGLFEFQQSVTVENGGYVVVNLTHCSDYILTEQPLSGNTANGTVPAAGAGTGAKGAGQGNLDSTPHTGI